MSNICTIPLYSRKENTLDFILETIQESTLDNVVENVAGFLKEEASFATTIDVAEDLEGYEDNIINKLIPNIISEIEKGLKIRLTPLKLSEILKELKQQFLPKIESNGELEIPTTETQEEKRNKKQNTTLRQLKNSIFRGSNLLYDYHLKEFSKQIRETIIYNPNKKQRSLVYDLRTLNENLKLYKLNLYETVYNYCKLNEIKVPQHRSYYYSDNTVAGEEVLDIFYKYLMEMNPDQRLELLEKSWENITLGKTSKNINLLLAVNAYITLNKFDDLLKNTVGNYILYNKRLDEPINTIEHNGTTTVKYKYNFGRRQSNMLKNFGEEMQNALDKMGNFAKFLIESIPKIDSTENLTLIQFINAMLHFKTALRRIPDVEQYKIYKQALKSLHQLPKERWKEALNAFVNESNYDVFITTGGMTSEDINIILSIQKYIYGKYAKDKENSLYKLELEVHNLVGYKELYSLIDTILGTIDSISEINYLETAWDYETNMPVVRIKRKYFNNKQKLDLISGINQEASKPLSIYQKEKYNISYLGGPFSFLIGNSIITIKPKRYSEFGIFDKDLEVTINGKPIDSYFKDINLTGAENRKNVLLSTGNLNGKNYTDKLITQDKLNKLFLDLLKYIDGALTTGLSINNESLLKFFIYNTLSEKGLENLVVAASRTYLVKDILRKFQESIDKEELNPETNQPYNKRDLHNWIKNNKSLVPIVLFTKEENKENKKYFGTLLGIPYLKPVQFNEDWVDLLGDAQAVLMGEALKAVTKNFDGKNVPNYSPAFLGGDVWEVMERNNENPTTKRLLFSTKSNAIKNIIIDTDVRSLNGKTKQVKDMTEAELQYHFFVNKFILPFKPSNEKPYSSFYSQPTVYSDKSKFVGYDINLADIGITDLKDDEKIIQMIQESLGEYFSEVLKNILNDYSKLFTFTKLISSFIENNEREPDLEELNNIKEQVKNSAQLSILEIQSELKSRTLEQLMGEVVEYNKVYKDSPIELILDLHYRTVNGKLGLNEILIYRNGYFFKNLPQMMEKATLDYVNTLLNSGVIFDTNAGFREALNSVATSVGIKIEDWLDSSGMLVLAKRRTENGDEYIIGGEEITDFTNIEINPLLKKYTLLHNLINNNLKEALFGTDGIHKVKPKPAELNVNEKKLLGFDILLNVDLVDAFISIENLIDSEIEAISPDPSEEEILEYTETLAGLEEIRQKIISQIREIESAADIAQLKRTVTGPGTMKYYLLGTLTGILPTLRGAIIQDVKASTFNFEGETKEDLEAHDGEAKLNPITAVWLNNSLLDSEVGDIIKPLWHVEIPTYGGKRLVKYAAGTITNSMMKNSELSEISMYHMFKKMTNISWDGLYWSDEKNLFNLYSHRRNNTNVYFSDITQSSGPLYYSIGNRTFQIIGIGFESGVYYTEEQEVKILSSNNSVVSVKDSYVVYQHYFDNKGNHYKIKEGESIPEGFNIATTPEELSDPTKLHTINSIYELHKVFGGIYSLDFKEDLFVTSDASIKAVASLLNMVSEPTQKYLDVVAKGGEIEDTQSYYYQPLKYKMIDYLINQSAIKNGTGNINFSTTYQNPEHELNDPANDEPLRYIEMDTLRYGIQQDSEHEADEEELTEMSLVISAIDAGGYYHEEVNELYKAIGHLALEAAKVELSKIKQFKETGNQDILYDLIGRTLIEHLSLNRGQNGIAEGLMDRIRKHFGTSTDHSFDEIKIAFSDLAIYNLVISTIASILNKKSVKRKFPGTGQVMAAGYNIVLLWNIDGKNARYEDLIKEALEAGFTSDYTTPEQYNKDIVKKYLADRQAKYAEKYTKTIPLKTNGTNYDENFWEGQLLHINPIDIVQCTVDNVILKPIKLDKIRDYYQFKYNPILYLLDKGLITQIPKELKVVKRIDIPSNLAPLQYKFVYEDEQGIKHSKNVYDIWAVKDMYFAVETFRQSLDPSLSKYEKDKLVEQERIRLRAVELNVLSNLEKYIYIDRNGKEYKIIKQESKAAQTLMSNIFRTKFGIKPGESLYSILKEGPKRFVKNPLKMLPNENIYDLAMLKSNGEGVLISFNDDEINSVQGFYKVKEKAFLNINEHEVIKNDNGTYYDLVTKEGVQGKTLNGQDIYSYIYSLDSNNMETIPIAIKIDVSDKIEFNGENYVYKNTKEKVSGDLDLSRKDNKILQTVEFVNKKLISPKHLDKYTIYNIKDKLISSLLGETYIQQIVLGLYLQDNYTYIMPARFVNPNNIKTISKSINKIKDTTKDSDIRSYLRDFESILSGISKSKDTVDGGLVLIKGYNNIFKSYNLKLAEKVFNSFKESLYFISSRIPALSLQSFMKMECIGFTNSEANIAYVSHWQAWLLGSDYDIDKSYMLGNEFDNNGLYQGWSPLFNFLYMEESKNLPFPTGIECYMPKEEGVGISIEEFVNEYIALDKNDERGKLNLINRLIRYINKYTPEYSDDFKKEIITIAKFDDDKKDVRRNLVELVRQHNTYKKGLSITEASLKNFISNKLLKIIQGTSNFIGSHAPITMGYLHEAADAGGKTQTWNTSNPGYIPLMLTQAMVGKKGVGIAANGQKASFIWKYWMTDCINNDNPYKEFVRFPENFHINRIEGRFGFTEYKVGSILDKYIKRLPDVNMYNASEEDKVFFDYNEDHYIPSDLMSSLMISAATDNAKELILDRINANTDLSKMYMYLITLGFDVKDIVSFMTSPVINLIARNSILNIFLDTSFRTKDVANFILNYIDNILELDLEEKSSRREINSINDLYSFVLNNKIKALLGNITDLLELQNIKEDVEEFLKIYELSEEFSYAGRFLGMNGGVPTTKETLIDFKKFIKNMFSSRELYVGLKTRKKGRFEISEDVSMIPEDLLDIINNLDPDKYLSDSEYRYKAMRYYELIKGSVNIPAMVEGTELFQSILLIADIVDIVDGEGVAKSKALNLIYDKILKKFPYADSKYAMQILPILNQIIISNFVETNPIIIPVQKNWRYPSDKWELKTFSENGEFNIGNNNYGLNTNSSLSAFHYLMDEFIIPQLKNGDPNLGFNLKNNAFIQNLIPIIDGTEVRYKINIDMRAALTNPESKVILKDIIKGLQELQNYEFGNKTLLDIFMLYSLVVDQNKQGSDRLTDLFTTFVNESNYLNNLMLDYHKFVGEMDHDNSEFIKRIDKLSVNGFLVALANQVPSTNGHNEPSVKTVTNDGNINYQFNVGFGKYRSFGSFLPRIALESDTSKLLRLSIREQYKFGLIYDGYIMDILDNFENLDNSEMWIKTFSELLSEGNLNLDTLCD